MILVIAAVFPPEPVVSATLANDLVIALSEFWDVKVLTPRPSRPMGFSFKEERIENRKFEHIMLNSFICPQSRLFGRMRESYSFGKHAIKYIKKNQADIQCIYIKAWPLFAQYLIVRVAKRNSIPSIIHIQDIYPELLLGKLRLFRRLFYRLLLPIDKYVLKNSSRVITISPNMKNILLSTRNLQKQKVDIAYNWQNEDFFIKYNKSKTKKQKSSIFTFMFLGNLSRTSAIHILISAFRNSGIENSRLIIAGNGSEKDFLISLADSYLGVNIEFWDSSMSDVPKIQDEADVLLLSLKKNAAQFALPSKLTAYMFSKKPIIACIDEYSDTANIIKQANCGWIVPPEDINALSQTMLTVASINKIILNNYGMNGYNYAIANFSKKKNLSKILSIIDKVVNDNFNKNLLSQE